MSEWLKENIEWLAWMINGILVGIFWALRKTFTRLELYVALEQRVIELEGRVDEMPSSEQMHSLELKIIELQGEINRIEPLLKRVEQQSNLLLENELIDRRGRIG